jgi:two-component system cell cycle sensor histidine kinase/response regulator CckA
MPDHTQPPAPDIPRQGETNDMVLFGNVEDLRQVLNHLQSGVVAHAPDTSIRVCNPRACEILGLTMDQMIGVAAPDPQWTFLREDGSAMPLEEFPVSVVLRSQQRLEGLLVGVNRPAHEDVVWAHCNGHPVFDEAGNLQLIIISFIDVTELRKAEQARQALQVQLQQATKMEAIGRLAGGIAHDFNNILTGIIGYGELLQAAVDPSQATHRYATEIQKCAGRAADLIRQLLAFARKQVVEPQVMQLNDVLERSEDMLRRLMGADIDLVFRPGQALANVRGDPGQLDQVLMNLVVNARDAMPSGGRLSIETRNITLEGVPNPVGDEPVSGPYLLLEVSDNGLGMDAATQSRIFEPFFTTKGPGMGTGLGLATVYGIVQQSGGFIAVYSEPGHGTTFKVYLPAVAEPASPSAEPESAVDGSVVATILLVEDEDMVRELARQVLSAHGYTVMEAADANEALMLIRGFSGPIDLLLTDVVMPGLNGPELLKEIRVARPELQALFMSGYPNDAIGQKDGLGAATDFVQKPFTVQGLLNRVNKMLASPGGNV